MFNYEVCRMNEFVLSHGIWRQGVPVMDKEGNESIEWVVVPITDVPVTVLLQEYEDLLFELYNKEVKLLNVKEEYNRKEFEIVYTSDIDFKALYGSTAEKVRKQHAKDALTELDSKISDLELSISWIRTYIPLLREVIKVKQ